MVMCFGLKLVNKLPKRLVKTFHVYIFAEVTRISLSIKINFKNKKNGYLERKVYLTSIYFTQSTTHGLEQLE